MVKKHWNVNEGIGTALGNRDRFLYFREKQWVRQR